MNTPLHEFEKIFIRVLKEIEAEDQQSISLLKLFNDLISALSETSFLQFNTLFARVSFICTRYQLNKAWTYAMQLVRKELRQRQMSDQDLIPILKQTIEYLFSIYRNELHPERFPSIIIPSLPKLPPVRSAGRYKKKFTRVIAVEWNKEQKLITAIDEEVPDVPVTIQCCVEGVNDIFCDTLELAIIETGLPLVLGLTDIDTTEEHHYIPSYIVILPDLLIDVTSIAQAWPSPADPLAVNIIDQFLPSDTTQAILTGHVANFFLDELVRDSNVTYSELFSKTFKLFPIEFVQLTDDKLKSMYKVMQTHFENIHRVIDERFPGVGIDKNKCIIEPSYFSPQYGIKGRLDLYYCHNGDESASIVELKSGKPFKPNSYGLSSSNYHQTLLYELLIKSVHGPAHHRANFILYSSVETDTLRYAVSVESIQKETIQNRNQLVLLQLRMAHLDRNGARDILGEIRPDHFAHLKGYIKTNIETWHKTYGSLSEGEKNYFKHFSSFITREHMQARIGTESDEGTSGLAGLWLDTIEAKEKRYQILQGVELLEIKDDAQQTLLRFSRSEITNPLANFRSGDIAIMYPYAEESNVDPTKHQLYRANVLNVNASEVWIRLRNNQIHTDQLLAVKKWNIEHDLLDSSFRSLYQSLWAFISTDVVTRQLIFGLRKPQLIGGSQKWPDPVVLTGQQKKIFEEALQSDSLYLLWGPPGTGKTSRMLRSWVWYYFFHTTKKIALLAYTNRAVDEICHVLHELGNDIADHYLRIGSRSGTGESFRCRLLDIVIEPMSKRSQIKQLLDSTRIFVGTVASLQGKSEIFKLVNFDLAIVDEASQILEPSMVGLLSRFKKAILIGDHMQLPAVSTQPSSLSSVSSEHAWAKQIGLTDLGMSYFERLYRLYHAKGWEQVIGVLSEQGRMHSEIQAFANQFVYNGKLTTIDSIRQDESISSITRDFENPLFTQRLLYVPSDVFLNEIYLKTNQQEADRVLDIILMWKEKMLQQGMSWSMGVITPFRAQIAAILHKAHVRQIDLNDITVDTVERYQGGARDIIIMSTSVNNRSALQRVVSLNAEGIDRKLNVAVTRARQQFILLGNEKIVKEEKSYNQLISMSHTWTMKESASVTTVSR